MVSLKNNYVHRPSIYIMLPPIQAFFKPWFNLRVIITSASPSIPYLLPQKRPPIQCCPPPSVPPECLTNLASPKCPHHTVVHRRTLSIIFKNSSSSLLIAATPGRALRRDISSLAFSAYQQKKHFNDNDKNVRKK